ncbi:MAG: hypothetical protein KatS3mg087_0504 [Patescibacteria group bacterium]|nr:MAG: hypothetical protein KatS3mg087_0504 [Patescibacteria group bacterium]
MDRDDRGYVEPVMWSAEELRRARERGDIILLPSRGRYRGSGGRGMPVFGLSGMIGVSNSQGQQQGRQQAQQQAQQQGSQPSSRLLFADVLNKIVGGDYAQFFELARGDDGKPLVVRDPSGRILKMTFKQKVAGQSGNQTAGQATAQAGGDYREFSIVYNPATGKYNLSTFDDEGNIRILSGLEMDFWMDPATKQGRFVVAGEGDVNKWGDAVSKFLMRPRPTTAEPVGVEQAQQPSTQPGEPSTQPSLFFLPRKMSQSQGGQGQQGQTQQPQVQQQPSLLEQMLPILMLLALRGRGGSSGGNDDFSRPIIIG